MVADSTTRQNIEDCIKLLRIREYKDRVSEQLRVQFPAPTKVTWKDLEVIVEVQGKLKNDAESWALTLQQELTRRRKDFKKKEPAARAGEEAPKKPAREAHNAERAKHSYNKDFHKKRLQSPHEHELNNAKMREYNLKHMFPKHKMGITTEEWLKLPEVKQQRAAASAEVQTRLTAELSSMQAAGQAGGGDGARAQALSEDELEYESHFNEREGYAAEDRLGSAGEEEVVNDHLEDVSMPELRRRQHRILAFEKTRTSPSVETNADNAQSMKWLWARSRAWAASAWANAMASACEGQSGVSVGCGAHMVANLDRGALGRGLQDTKCIDEGAGAGRVHEHNVEDAAGLAPQTVHEVHGSLANDSLVDDVWAGGDKALQLAGGDGGALSGSAA
ncbi:hypothetical protein CYMTET_39943 [Cymbomonas tetramitiformis]|uniref:Uncharacterized protein n=1 Tax=Cymbomonas tetramitiformis TaxID=36881 RepID=A0AAE0F407_9CHLO|nr:hypothetical protein CYMTET_39943 [Cymbomonas tetramitiformis]